MTPIHGSLSTISPLDLGSFYPDRPQVSPLSLNDPDPLPPPLLVLDAPARLPA